MRSPPAVHRLGSEHDDQASDRRPRPVRREGSAGESPLLHGGLSPVGLDELHVQADGVHYGAEGLDDFAIYAGSPSTTAAHVAFDAPNRASVDGFFEAAMANGGRERGRPAVWTQYSERYYAAFVNDPDGNNVEAVFHSPTPITDAPRRAGVP
jgi:catechol 2,3-dioxygenase-like lactoylglutathione lyase family enzyme